MINLDVLNLAVKIAIKRTGDRRTFFIGAIGRRADGVLVHARNEAADKPTPAAHAEARLCRKLGFGAETVWVARYSVGRKKLAIAKPCKNCERMLRERGVKEVIYSTNDGSFEKLVFN